MSYDKLSDRFARLSKLNDAAAILKWDEAVTMPTGGAGARNEALAELGLIAQELGADPQIGRWLDDAAGDDEWRRGNLRAMRRRFEENTVVPPELNRRLNVARMAGEQAWRVARAANDWAGFKPRLAEIVVLSREMIDHVAQARGLTPYDAALSLFSPGLTTAVVERLFNELKSFLPDLIREVVAKQKTEKTVIPLGPFPVAAQAALGREVMGQLGFDFSHGRLDVSHHPFCGGIPRDVRITTRYQEDEFITSLMGIIHESGHALYEQHLPADWLTQPVGHAAGMAAHESQSLFFEMQVGRSTAFLKFLGPRLRAHLGRFTENPGSLDDANLARLVTRAAPGLIRVNADEVTYPMHVILRFELERALIEGTLEVDDLPDAWDEKMRGYLGLRTRGNDRDGCLQDVHWPAGLFGYFPAYTFGAVIAAQLFARARADRPTLTDEIARGEFTGVRTWLNEKIWSRASVEPELEMIERAAGRLTADAFRAHLEARYLAT